MVVGVTALSPVDARPFGRAIEARTDPYERATVFVASAAVLVAGVDRKVAFGASASLPVAVLLLPLWIGALRRFAQASTLAVLAGAALVGGWLLSEQAAADHHVVAATRNQAVGLFLTGLAVLVLVVWARSVMPTHRVAALFGAGGLLGAVSAGQTSWKFDLAVPVTFLVLGLIERRPRRGTAVVAVIVLGVLGVLDDGRSYFALCLLAAALSLWQLRSRDPSERVRRWTPALLIVLVTVVIYLMATALLTGGYLGSEAQARSTEQIETTGSLIVGGRPEWAATRELVKLRPLGYGLGVVPSWEDVRAGKAGLQSVNVALESHRQAYMFGGQFRLHSILADLWVSYGLLGVALGVAMLVAVLRSMSVAIAERTLDTSGALAATLAVWFVFFGPIYSNWVGVCFGVGLVLTQVDRPPAPPRAAEEPPAAPGGPARGLRAV